MLRKLYKPQNQSGFSNNLSSKIRLNVESCIWDKTQGCVRVESWISDKTMGRIMDMEYNYGLNNASEIKLSVE